MSHCNSKNPCTVNEGKYTLRPMDPMGKDPVINRVWHGSCHVVLITAQLFPVSFWILFSSPTRWALTSYKWSYNLYKWPYKWVTGVITLLMVVITPFITDRGPPCPSQFFLLRFNLTPLLAWAWPSCVAPGDITIAFEESKRVNILRMKQIERTYHIIVFQSFQY